MDSPRASLVSFWRSGIPCMSSMTNDLTKTPQTEAMAVSVPFLTYLRSDIFFGMRILSSFIQRTIKRMDSAAEQSSGSLMIPSFSFLNYSLLQAAAKKVHFAMGIFFEMIIYCRLGSTARMTASERELELSHKQDIYVVVAVDYALHEIKVTYTKGRRCLAPG